MLPKERIIAGLGLSEFNSPATLYRNLPMEQFGPPRFLGSPLAPLPRSRDPGRVTFATVIRLSDVAPARQTTKATATSTISGLIHTASVPAVYASRFGFPYTGKTRFRWVTALTGWDSNPLDSVSEFQSRLFRRLSQRSRLVLARLSFRVELGDYSPNPPTDPYERD